MIVLGFGITTALIKFKRRQLHFLARSLILGVYLVIFRQANKNPSVIAVWILLYKFVEQIISERFGFHCFRQYEQCYFFVHFLHGFFGQTNPEPFFSFIIPPRFIIFIRRIADKLTKCLRRYNFFFPVTVFELYRLVFSHGKLITRTRKILRFIRSFFGFSNFMVINVIRVAGVFAGLRHTEIRMFFKTFNERALGYTNRYMVYLQVRRSRFFKNPLW